ncbi:MAG: hypothetical protein WCO06_04520 [Candidatus Roizmanbacteria bacterium]
MIIALDLDDVLAQLGKDIHTYHNELYGTHASFETQTDYSFSTNWNCTEEEVIKRIYDFYATDRMLSLEPVEGSIHAITPMSKQYELHIVTARPELTRNITEQWVKKHFGSCITHIHMTGQCSLDQSIKKTKSQICKEIRAELLIDDHIDYVMECTRNNVKTLLLETPINRPKLVSHPLITRVKNWKEIEDLLT